MLPNATMQSERSLRELIQRNLRKEIHSGTKPSIDFIKKILDDAYNQGMVYDVTDMQSRILSFANNSSNRANECLTIALSMKYVGKTADDISMEEIQEVDDRIVIYDVEVFPNLFVVCWKYRGSKAKVRMINPSPQDIEKLIKMKLVGFYNRQYDNHILYARFLGYNNEQLYTLSKKLIEERKGGFGEAYSISYADIYEFSSRKQGLKKWEIELGIHHLELDIPWDEAVPENLWEKVAEYCENDVDATEATFEACIEDFNARQILAALSGLAINETTARHTARIIFGTDRNPQSNFLYTDLSKEFPGYVHDFGKSTYRGHDVGEGGLVKAKPGMYENVALLDVASMHPTSIEVLNMFGDYTSKFSELKAARLAIKHGDYDEAKVMLSGKLAPFLKDQSGAEALSYALKIVINIVYGLTSAKFDNPFRDPRNKDNIAAKRGALFMLDLMFAVEEQGFTVAHIKTDSIKIPNATPEIIDFVMNFGEKYGYAFEHEATYSKMALVNDAVYVAKYGWAAKAKKIGTWEAVGAQFQHPYVFKSLFTKGDITFDDMCETKSVVKGAMYLDFSSVREPMYRDEGKMHFVGRTGRFIPVTEESGGAILYCVRDGKNHHVSGTKGYLWLEAVHAKHLGEKLEINETYFESLVYSAVKTLDKFGDAEEFVK